MFCPSKMAVFTAMRQLPQIMENYVEFTHAHPGVPWRSMRGMRNRIAHGYFDINLDMEWNTIQAALPTLLNHMMPIRLDHLTEI